MRCHGFVGRLTEDAMRGQITRPAVKRMSSASSTRQRVSVMGRNTGGSICRLSARDDTSPAIRTSPVHGRTARALRRWRSIPASVRTSVSPRSRRAGEADVRSVDDLQPLDLHLAHDACEAKTVLSPLEIAVDDDLLRSGPAASFSGRKTPREQNRERDGRLKRERSGSTTRSPDLPRRN